MPLYSAVYDVAMADRTRVPSAELLTTREVARLFRVTRSTVTSWAYRGLLPYTTTPTGHLRFYRASIERRLAERHGTGDRR
jgi:excisionase family DNA binding protein